MISVQITGVPEGTHAVLLERAARADQSLQEYLLGLLVREANSPTLDEVLDRADNRSGVIFADGGMCALSSRHPTPSSTSRLSGPSPTVKRVAPDRRDHTPCRQRRT